MRSASTVLARNTKADYYHPPCAAYSQVSVLECNETEWFMKLHSWEVRAMKSLQKFMLTRFIIMLHVLFNCLKLMHVMLWLFKYASYVALGSGIDQTLKTEHSYCRVHSSPGWLRVSFQCISLAYIDVQLWACMLFGYGDTYKTFTKVMVLCFDYKWTRLREFTSESRYITKQLRYSSAIYTAALYQNWI